MLRALSVVLVCALFCTMAQADAHVEKPIVYLTFDDGPSGDGVTDELLDVLERHNARATFFVTGARVLANPEKIRLIYRAGHALGNHTVSHTRLTNLFEHQIAAELSATNLYVMEAGGPPMTCFRAPFGAVNQKVVSIADSMGMARVGWTIDTRDWDPYADIRDIASQLERARHKSVVLMHDGPRARWRSLKLFTRWIEDFGHLYSFEPLPECERPSPLVTLSVLANNDSQQALPQPAAQPVSLPAAQPVALPAAQPLPVVVKPAVSPVTQPVVEPVVAAVVAPVTQPVVAAVAAPVTQPVTASITQPVNDPVREHKSDNKHPRTNPLAQVSIQEIKTTDTTSAIQAGIEPKPAVWADVEPAAVPADIEPEPVVQPVKTTSEESIVKGTVLEYKVETIRSLINKLENYDIELQD